MVCHFYQPHPLLQSFVSTIMVYAHAYDPSLALPVDLFPPIPEHSLYFYPRDPVMVHHPESGATFASPPSIIVGPQVARVNLSLGYNHVIVRVGFQVGGLHRLLGLPLHRLVDFAVDPEDFFGPGIRETTDRLREATSPDHMKAIVEGLLLQWTSKVRKEELLDGAMQALVKSGGRLSMDYLAKESCLSVKQFSRKCKDRIGLAPKLFSRIVRFSNAYRMRESNALISWTSIAHSAGYFDQMHLIRDFKVFTGTLPTGVDKELALTTSRLQADLRL